MKKTQLVSQATFFVISLFVLMIYVSGHQKPAVEDSLVPVDCGSFRTEIWIPKDVNQEKYKEEYCNQIVLHN